MGHYILFTMVYPPRKEYARGLPHVHSEPLWNIACLRRDPGHIGLRREYNAFITHLRIIDIFIFFPISPRFLVVQMLVATV
jgi:hypothetical protein